MSDSEKTTLENILDAAQDEFLEKGFQGASLRSIVKKAGVTTGAFYGYYKSKEELLDALVKEPYTFLLNLYREILNAFSDLPPEKQQSDMQSFSASGMWKMTEYIYNNIDVFKLLLCCCEGTKYENLVHEMAEIDMQATNDFAEIMKKSGVVVKRANPYLEHMLISGMFSAYFELIIHDIPKEQAQECTDQLLEFYTAGWKKIMEF